MTGTQRKLLILVGIIVSGCATTEPLPTFYTLGPAGAHRAVNQRVSQSVRAYVNRVILPPYLNRTNLASFRGNQVEYSSSAFWAVPLDQAVAQAVARNLNAVGVSAVGFQPLASPPAHSYEVTMRISQCQGYDTGEVIFSGVWEIYSAGGASKIAAKSFNLHRSGWPAGHYASMASLLADEVTECSKQIAASLGR
jgi:uncharacterized lipoprotein YmbA